MLSRTIKRAYHKVIVEHFNHPKNIGKLDPKDPNVGTGLVGAPACFHGNTRIALKSSIKSLKDVYKQTNNGKEIIEVWSFNIYTNEYELRNARVLYTGKKVMDVLTLSDGISKIVTTPDHMFLTVNTESNNKKRYTYVENNKIQSESLVSFTKKLSYFEDENYGIIKREPYGEDDCYTLQVEVTNNYCILLNDSKGLVVKNCGDVIKIQIKVDENDKIVDSKCKIFGCLAGNVKISTPDNPNGKKIKDCNVGDTIWAWNGKEIVKNEIENIYIHYVSKDDLMYLQFEEGEFVCTKSHIWWKEDDTPVESENLNVGDSCLLLSPEFTTCKYNGLKVVRKETELSHNLLRDIEKNEEGLYKVYDIKCKEGANVYFAGRIATHNCGSAIANTSFASELIKGKTLTEASSITNMDIAKATHSNQIKLHCSSLAADAIKAAVDDIKKKRESS